MAMTAGPSSGIAATAPMVDINTTPLVDVMLVLLIIFMITAPLLTHKISLPLVQQTDQDLPDLRKVFERTLELRDLSGAVEIRLDSEPISMQALLTEFRAQGAKIKSEQNAYKLQADESVRYSAVADILAAAKRAHVQRIGFDKLGSPIEAAGASSL